MIMEELTATIGVVWFIGVFFTLVFFRLERMYALREGKTFVGLINPYQNWDAVTWAKYFGLSLLWPLYLTAGVLAIPFVMADLLAQGILQVVVKLRRKQK